MTIWIIKYVDTLTLDEEVVAHASTREGVIQKAIDWIQEIIGTSWNDEEIAYYEPIYYAYKRALDAPAVDCIITGQFSHHTIRQYKEV